jgi:lipopolysaccharide transport system ATP-binding protein
MSSEIAIKLEQIGKRYQLYEKPHDRLKQSIYPRLQRLAGKPPRQYYREFAALEDVSFEVRRGETVGIIGRNGSGKSTLLQIICGTLNASSGNVQVRGRIAALLELGAGFNLDFTGRENIRMSCALLGLSESEADDLFDDIASFADIGDFIEQPVKTYSSGMFVRLAFAVNIVTRPDIMVVDEALAVGDMSFQAKCTTALRRIQEAGATVLFVSHDIGTVKNLCTRAVYLERGKVKAIGQAPDIAELYVRDIREEMNARQSMEASASKVLGRGPTSEDRTTLQKDARIAFTRSPEFEKRTAASRYGSGGARITYMDLLDEHDDPVRQLEFDQQVKVAICLETDVDEQISCNYYIADSKRNYLIGSGMDLPGYVFRPRKGGQYVVVYKTRIPLSEGNYSIQLELTRPLIFDQSVEFLDVIDDALVFQVEKRRNGRVWAQMYVPNTVQVTEA